MRGLFEFLVMRQEIAASPLPAPRRSSGLRPVPRGLLGHLGQGRRRSGGRLVRQDNRRRVKIPVELISSDPRSRRRRTVAKDQLALALGGAADHVWAVSFLVTNIPADGRDYVALEAWFRNRTSIEERFREAKNGGGLNHLPSDHAVNSVWMWTGLLAGALSVMLQSVSAMDRHRPDAGRMRIATLRQQLLAVPGRLIRHARGLTLRHPPQPMSAATSGLRPAARPARTHLTSRPPPPRPGPRRHRPTRRAPSHARFRKQDHKELELEIAP